jgi:hypothetical protein
LVFNWEIGRVKLNEVEYEIVRLAREYENIELTVGSLTTGEIGWTYLFKATSDSKHCSREIYAMIKKYNGCQNRKFYFYAVLDNTSRNGFITYEHNNDYKRIVVNERSKPAFGLRYEKKKETENLIYEENKSQYGSNLINIKNTYNHQHSFKMSKICAAKLKLLVDTTRNPKTIITYQNRPDLWTSSYETYKLFNFIHGKTDNIFELNDSLARSKEATLEIYDESNLKVYEVESIYDKKGKWTAFYSKNKERIEIPNISSVEGIESFSGYNSVRK